MSTGYKIVDQEALHYVTFQIVNWVDLFTRQVYRDIVVDSLKFCQTNKGLEIYAFVIMSNHIHILLRSGISKLSDTIREFKVTQLNKYYWPLKWSRKAAVTGC